MEARLKDYSPQIVLVRREGRGGEGSGEEKGSRAKGDILVKRDRKEWR